VGHQQFLGVVNREGIASEQLAKSAVAFDCGGVITQLPLLNVKIEPLHAFLKRDFGLTLAYLPPVYACTLLLSPQYHGC
jgi:hypothetical protein